MYEPEQDPIPEIDNLLDKALSDPRGGKALAMMVFAQRKWLIPLVARRLDPRLAARLDPKDVVQDIVFEALQKLNAYLQLRPVPFAVWLAQIAYDQVAYVHRTHMRTAKRSVRREVQMTGHSSTDTGESDAGPFGTGSSDAGPFETGFSIEDVPSPRPPPSSVFRRKEQRELLEEAILLLSDAEREVVELRREGQFSTREIAEKLGISEAAVRTRQLRAVCRLRELLGGDVI